MIIRRRHTAKGEAMTEHEAAIRAVVSQANEVWKRVTGTPWSLFFIDGLAYMADWMGALRPELTRDFLAALAEAHRVDLDRDGYERARKMIDVRRRALIESFETDAGPTRQ